MSNPSAFETWMPLLAFALVIVSWFIHKMKETPHEMTFKETAANLSIFIVWRFVFFAGGLALQFWIFTHLAQFIPWKLPKSPWIFGLAVLLADFCYYWKHRYEHLFNFLWAEHVVHHSSEEFNLSTSLRLPWVASYLNWFFFVPALFLGFSATQILMGHQVVLAYQYLIHTELVNKTGFLEHILNTPSHHRVHHGRNERYLDKNYGGILIVWDKLFGTFAPETETVDFGTVHPMTSKNPIVINVQPWKDLFHMTQQVPLTKKIKLLVTAPADTELFLKVNQRNG
jgi:sterol desaturase/sphingolipid hydroxylase (fatty acid hydroxylase superfamily)